MSTEQVFSAMNEAIQKPALAKKFRVSRSYMSKYFRSLSINECHNVTFRELCYSK